MASSLKESEGKRESRENAAEVANATLRQDEDDTKEEEDEEKKMTDERDETKNDTAKPQVAVESFAGSYKFDTSSHLDEYLKNLGVGLVFRKVQSAANPTMTIFPGKGGEWTIKMDSIFRTREVKFRLGVEFTDETFDGRGCRSTATLEGPNRLLMTQRCTQGSDVKVVYELRLDNTMQLCLTSGPHTASLTFSSNSDL